MNIQRDNVDERRQRVDAILAQVRSSTRLRPARIRRVTRSLGGLVDQVIPITGRRLSQNSLGTTVPI